MPTRFTLIDSRISAIGALMVVLLVGCSPTTAPGGSATSVAGPSPTVAATVAGPSPTVAGPSPTLAGRDAPPEAQLAAEGGDAVLGQLGSYTWLQSGSDSPWLPGAPIAVGAGEPLTVGLVPAGDLADWRARYVPSNAGDPRGAVVLGEGTGDPAFRAPKAGSWTVELFVEFAAGAGTASYYWLLDVS